MTDMSSTKKKSVGRRPIWHAIPKIQRLLHFLSGDLVMVYTMGKVGSTAVEANLASAFHTHTLYGLPPSPPYHRLKYGRFRVALRRLFLYPAKRFVLRRRKSIKIITFYRDPKTRNPSMFFQDLPFWLTEFYLRSGAADPNVNRAEAQELLPEAYKAIFPHEYPATWVERELAPFTGVGAEELALGRADYKVVDRGKIAIFIGRAEAMTACAKPLAEFLGLDSLEMRESNRGLGKWYAPVYRVFQSQLSKREDIDYCETFRRANGYE